MNSYKTPYDDKPYEPPKNNQRRYATAGIVLAGALVGGSFLSGYNNRNYGTPFSYAGQKYYIPGDSRRAVYPSREACMADVPLDRQNECEPKGAYSSSGVGRWYGPVYSPRDRYQPSGQYQTEKATSANVGNKLPKASSSYGFGADGKAFTGSKGS